MERTIYTVTRLVGTALSTTSLIAAFYELKKMCKSSAPAPAQATSQEGHDNENKYIDSHWSVHLLECSGVGAVAVLFAIIFLIWIFRKRLLGCCARQSPPPPLRAPPSYSVCAPYTVPMEMQTMATHRVRQRTGDLRGEEADIDPRFNELNG